MVPYRYSLLDPSVFSSQLSSWGPQVEEAVALEALRRGAEPVQLISLLWQWRSHHSPSPSPAAAQKLSFGLPPLQLAEHPAPRDVQQWITAYQSAVRSEFGSLPPEVQASFRFDKTDPLTHYFKMRPVYYCAGFTDPAGSIFSKIAPARLLYTDIACGVHHSFRDVLAQVPAVLDGWTRGLAEKTAKEIKSVSGFVPRFIAPKQGRDHGKRRLSNHALGCAIDIDPANNPHIKDLDVIEALKAAVGYDFGKPFVSDTKGIPHLDVVAQSHLFAQDASRRLQAWLRKYLPVLDAYLDERRLSQGKHASPPKAAPFASSLPDPAPACRVLDPATKVHIVRLETILKYHSRRDLELWALKGIQTVPLYLAAAMAQLGVAWGTCYVGSKDMMHFELPLQPDSKSRSLDELIGWAHIQYSHHKARQSRPASKRL